MKGHLRRAHSDENKIALNYIKEGYPALRIPGSGTSQHFPGDVIAFTSNATIHLVLVRRTEKADKIIFKRNELEDVGKLALQLTSLLFKVQVFIVAHFPRKRKWIKHRLTDYGEGDILVSYSGEIKVK